MGIAFGFLVVSGADWTPILVAFQLEGFGVSGDQKWVGRQR